MTKWKYRIWLVTVVLIAAAVLLAGRWIQSAALGSSNSHDPSSLHGSDARSWFELYKETRNGVFVLLAAGIALLYQRRNHFAKLLADSWPRTVAAVQAAIQYTHALPVGGAPPEIGEARVANQILFSNVMEGLSRSIDEQRALFKNPGSTGPFSRGLYPIEQLKQIQQAIGVLGYGPNFNPSNAVNTRLHIVNLWQYVCHSVPREFDRVEL